MRNLSIALAVCAMTALGASAANADDTPMNCATMAAKVNAAISSNQQSSNIAEATKEKGYGRDFCGNGLPKRGMEHYAQALKLLGAS